MKISNAIQFAQRQQPRALPVAAGLTETTSADQVQLSQRGNDVRPFDLETLKRQTAERADTLQRKMAPHRPGQVLLKLPPGEEFSRNERQELFEDFKFTSGRELKLSDSMIAKCGGRYFLAELPKKLTVAEAIAALEADGRAVKAEPNHIVTRDQVVIDSTVNRPR